MVVTKAVAMMALVKTAQAEEVGGRVTGGDGTFGGSAHGGGVVVEEREGALTGIDRLGEDVLVGDDASQFKVTVGEITLGIVIGNKTCLDVGGERGPP